MKTQKIKPFNFLGIKNIKSNSKKNIKSQLINFGFSQPKNMSKKNMNWTQAKTKYPKLNPWGDADGDGLINMFDCKPFDRKRQEELNLKPKFAVGSSYKKLIFSGGKSGEKGRGKGKSSQGGGKTFPTTYLEKVLITPKIKQTYERGTKEYQRKKIIMDNREKELKLRKEYFENRFVDKEKDDKRIERELRDEGRRRGGSDEEINDNIKKDKDERNKKFSEENKERKMSWNKLDEKSKKELIDDLESRDKSNKEKLEMLSSEKDLQGRLKLKRYELELKKANGEYLTGKEQRALAELEKKALPTYRLKQGIKSVTGPSAIEMVTSPTGGRVVGEGGEYTKEARIKSARVKRLTKAALGTLFGADVIKASGKFDSNASFRSRGRPAGPSGEYKIQGKPVYEQQFQDYMAKQRALNRLSPSEQAMKPMEQSVTQEQLDAQYQSQRQQQPTQEAVQQQYDNQARADIAAGIVPQPAPEQQQQYRPEFTQEEIRSAQELAQQEDNVLKAPNFSKGELKATGGSLLTSTGPQILDAPNINKGQMRTMQQGKDIPAVRLSERPQPNVTGSEYIEIDISSGKPRLMKRSSEAWLDGRAL